MAGTRGIRRNPLEAVRAFLARHAPDRGEVPACPVQRPYPGAKISPWPSGTNGTDVAEDPLKVLLRMSKEER